MPAGYILYSYERRPSCSVQPPASCKKSMMEVLNLKRAAKIVLIGVCFGLILLLLKISFGIDDAAFMHGYWIAAVAIVLGAVLINVCYNLI